MPDISMCANQSCPSRYKCYRFMAKPSGWQTYSDFIVKKGRVKCDSFLKLRTKVNTTDKNNG